MIIYNVEDRRFGWIGSWEVEPLDVSKLTDADLGRTVIYKGFRSEAGTLSSWNATTVWARFTNGFTAASCSPSDLYLAVRPLDGNPDRVRA